MQIKEVMTKEVSYVPMNTNLKEAAEKMAELDCGFLPLANTDEDKLRGVVTDRDIVIRGIAKGLDPHKATVDQVKTDQVLYCFEEDDISSAVDSMNEMQVHRLIVLNNKKDKRLRGVITLGDIFRHNADRAGAHAAKGITAED